MPRCRCASLTHLGCARSVLARLAWTVGARRQRSRRGDSCPDLSRRRRDRRRDPARVAQQVRVRRGGRRLPARSRPVERRLLQLRLRLHRGHARRRRRPHRRPADHRRADLHRLPRLGAPDRRARDARREGLRLQGPVRRDRRPPPAAHRAARAGPAAPPRRDRALLRDLQGCSRTRPSTSSAGASRSVPARSCATTASVTSASRVADGAATACSSRVPVPPETREACRRPDRAGPHAPGRPRRALGPPRQAPRHAPLPRRHAARPRPGRRRGGPRGRRRGARRSRSGSAARARSRPRAARSGRCGSGSSTARRSSGRSWTTSTPPLARLGWPAEARPFRPHLTVARTDATGIRDAALTAQALEAAAEDWTTDLHRRPGRALPQPPRRRPRRATSPWTRSCFARREG